MTVGQGMVGDVTFHDSDRDLTRTRTWPNEDRDTKACQDEDEDREARSCRYQRK
jgi:hypothetical protein